MTELARRILFVFAESYPTSASFKGGRRLRKAGWYELFPRITTDVSAKNDFLEAVEELVNAGILTARWKRFREGDDLEALYLEDPQSLFDALDMPSPESISDGMRQVLDSPEWRDPRLRELAEYLAPRLSAGHPVPVRNAAELEDLGRLFLLSSEEAASRPIRALSVRLYTDSKRLEKLIPIADRLSRATGSEPISVTLGLGRSYPEVSFAVRGHISLFGHAGPWTFTGEIVTLPAATLSRIDRLELESREMAPGPAVILSVENKETFHVLAQSQTPGLPFGIAGIVYAAGHPNDAVKSFLRLCVKAGARVFHYGDLDPDGILITQEIASTLAVPIVPWNMSVELHRHYAAYGYALDSTQMARLALVAETAPRELRELAREIGRTGIGVEQEIIDLEAVCGEP
jgi:hypothetical protein